MQEILSIICCIFACFCSYIAGRLQKEKEDLVNEIKTIDKGSAAGDNAVNSFKLHSKK